MLKGNPEKFYQEIGKYSFSDLFLNFLVDESGNTVLHIACAKDLPLIVESCIQILFDHEKMKAK